MEKIVSAEISCYITILDRQENANLLQKGGNEDSNIPEELIHFYEFIRTGKAEDILTEDLKNAVEEKNMAILYRSDYLRQREMLEDAMYEGIEQERANTEEQRKRADEEKQRADDLEKQLAVANAEIAKMENRLKELESKKN